MAHLINAWKKNLNVLNVYWTQIFISYVVGTI